MDAPVGHQIEAAALAVGAIELLKRLSFMPWINRNSDKLNRFISIVIALAYTGGFTVATEGSLLGGGHIVLSFAGAAGLLHLLGGSGQQYMIQELLYRGATGKLATAKSGPAVVVNTPAEDPEAEHRRTEIAQLKERLAQLEAKP